MGNSASSSSSNNASSGSTSSDPIASAIESSKSGSCPKVNAKGKKICCVCKETKGVRDECIVRNGEERCKQFIEAHNQCLREEGFSVN